MIRRRYKIGIIFTGAHFQHMTIHTRLLRCIAFQPQQIFERGAYFLVVPLTNLVRIVGVK